MVNNLVFYNTYHNGDVHYGREFIKRFAAHIPAVQKFYVHNKHPKTSLGCLNYGQAGNLPMEEHVFMSGGDLFINTWIGTDHRKFLQYGGVTMEGNYAMYTAAARHIKNLLNIDIPIEPIENYLPEIDFSRFKTDDITYFFDCPTPKVKVFIVNSNVMSGQSNNFDFDPIVAKLARAYPTVLFIMTNKSSLNQQNVIYTPDIHGISDGCDLVENSFISTKCNIIVGRGSGSFCFSCIKENWLDNTKSILGIGYKRGETLWYDSKNCSFTDDFSEENVYKTIESLIRKHDERN
jgi:hypothetical protein